MPEIIVELVLYDNPVSPKEISCRLGVEPTSITLKGQIMKNGRPRAPHVDFDIWHLESKGGCDVEKEWNYLKEKMGGAWGEFVKIANLGGKTYLKIVVTIKKRMPPVYIPAHMVKAAAEIGAIIDVLYYNNVVENDLDENFVEEEWEQVKLLR